LVWLDIASPTQAEVRGVMREYDVHPLVIDELLTPSVRQKTERYGDFLYLVLHFPALSGRHEHVAQEIDFIIGKHLLVTTRYEEIEPLRSFAKTFDTAATLEGEALQSHGGHILYLMVRTLYRALADEIEFVREELHHIEDRVFAGEEQKMVFEISHISRVILDFRRTLAPHEEILSSLDTAGGRLFGQEFSFYARLLQGEFLKVQSGLDELRDSLQELRETNNSLVSTKQNEIMKNLTIMAFVTFPLVLVSSMFSMNARYMPIVGAPGDFWIILGIMSVLALFFFIYFKTKRWL